MQAEVLSVADLSFSYVKSTSRFTVQLPELTLRSGEFVGLVGSSGCGKSTLLDVLGLVRRPARCTHFGLWRNVPLPANSSSSSKSVVSKSSVRTDMVDIASLWAASDDASLSRVRAQSLGYVLQSGGLIPYLSVGENIELPRRIAGLSVSRSATLQAMESLGLGWGYHKPVSDLSGGERQRVAILRAISHRPRLILADEPTAAVDTPRALEVVRTLAAMASEYGSAVLMVSHDLELTRQVASRVLTLQLQNDGNDTDTTYRAIAAAPSSSARAGSDRAGSDRASINPTSSNRR